jgi:hypothetical protein
VRTLFELTDEILSLEATITALEREDTAEVTQEQVDAIDAWLKEVGEEHERKLDGYAWYIRQLEREAEIAKEEEATWAAKKQARTKRADMLKARIKQHMEDIGRKVLKTDRTEFAIVGNGGARPIKIVDEAKIPAEYMASTPVVSKTLVGEAMAKGVEVPGAQYGDRGTRLRIK